MDSRASNHSQIGYDFGASRFLVQFHSAVLMFTAWFVSSTYMSYRFSNIKNYSNKPIIIANLYVMSHFWLASLLLGHSSLVVGNIALTAHQLKEKDASTSCKIGEKCIFCKSYVIFFSRNVTSFDYLMFSVTKII